MSDIFKEIKYKSTTYYIGRNGQGLQTGLALTDLNDTLRLEPINSKNHLANCMINIPKESILEVIDALQTVLNNEL